MLKCYKKSEPTNYAKSCSYLVRLAYAEKHNLIQLHSSARHKLSAHNQQPAASQLPPTATVCTLPAVLMCIQGHSIRPITRTMNRSLKQDARPAMPKGHSGPSSTRSLMTWSHTTPCQATIWIPLVQVNYLGHINHCNIELKPDATACTPRGLFNM